MEGVQQPGPAEPAGRCHTACRRVQTAGDGHSGGPEPRGTTGPGGAHKQVLRRLAARAAPAIVRATSHGGGGEGDARGAAPGVPSGHRAIQAAGPGNTGGAGHLGRLMDSTGEGDHPVPTNAGAHLTGHAHTV